MEERLQEILLELQQILEKIKQHQSNQGSSELDLKAFWDDIRPLFARLRPDQIRGTETKLQAFVEAQYPIAFASYALATSFHETAQRMLPVREGLSATDAWRKRNLRYYPYYGRGDVQLTWKANYEKADRELDLNGRLLANLDLALDESISAKVMVRGMAEGWFTGKKMIDYLPTDREASHAEFRRARRIINLMDKADLIAGYATKFQHALKEAGYGNSDIR